MGGTAEREHRRRRLRLHPGRGDRTLGPQPGERRRRTAWGDIRLGPGPRRDERIGAAAVPPSPGLGSDDHAPAVPAVRGRHPAWPDQHRTVRGAGSLLGRLPRLRQALRARSATDPAHQDRTAPRRARNLCHAYIPVGPTLTHGFEKALRTLGEGPVIDLVHDLEDGGEAQRLAAMEVNEALGYLWPRLRELTEVMARALTFTLGQARAWRRRGAEEGAWTC